MKPKAQTAPIEQNSQGTRARIVDAARELMIEHGVLEVSVADITAQAGVNIALVSYYFGGREGLMLAVAREDATLALSNLARLQASHLSPSAKIRSHVAGIIQAYFQRPYLNRLLQKLIREGSREASEEVSAFFVRPVAEARNAIIEEGIAAGEFRQVDPGLIGYALEGACAQIFTSSASREAVLGDGTMSQDLVDRYANSTSDLIVNGLIDHLRANSDQAAKGTTDD